MLKVLNIALWRRQTALKGSSIYKQFQQNPDLCRKFKLELRGLESLEQGRHLECQVTYAFAPSIGDHGSFLVLNTCRSDEHVQVKIGPSVLSPVSKVCVRAHDTEQEKELVLTFRMTLGVLRPGG